MSSDDAGPGPSHTKALQEKVLSKEKEIVDVHVKRKSKLAKGLGSPCKKQRRLIGLKRNSPKGKFSPRKQLSIRRVNVTPTKYKKFPFQSASPSRRSTRSQKGEICIDIQLIANFVPLTMKS